MKRILALALSLLMVTSVVATGAVVTGSDVAGAVEEGEDEVALTPGYIDTCGVIEQPGTYVLNQSITDPTLAAACFEVTVSDVVIDGDGHTITGGGLENSTVAYVHGRGNGDVLGNVTIRNLGATNLAGGIVYFNAADAVVTGNTLTDIDGEVVKLTSVDRASVTDNVITDNGGETVTFMTVSEGTIARNDISRNGGEAVVLSNSGGSGTVGTVIEDNTMVDNDGDGIAVRQGVTDTTVRGNTITGSTGKALFFMGASGNLVEGNTITNTTGDKAVHFTGGSPDNVLRDNVIAHNAGEQAVHFGGEATNNTVEGNEIYDNEGHGVTFGAPDSTVRDNLVYENGLWEGPYRGAAGLNFDLAGDNEISGNTVYGNGVGVLFTDSSNNVLADNDVYDNVDWDYRAVEGSTAHDVSDLRLDGTGDTVVAFDTSRDVALKGVPTGERPELPDGFENTGAWVEVANTSASGYVVLNVSYDQFPGEGELVLGRYDGTWMVLPGDHGVNTAENYVYAHVDTAGVFTPLYGDGDLEPPVADAGPDLMPIATYNFTLDASGSTDNVGIVSYEWLSADGTTVNVSTDQPVVETRVDTPGTYEVALTVTDAANNSDTDTVTVTVLERDTVPPAVDLGPDRTVLTGTTVTLTATATDNVGVTSYEWDFGGDGTVDNTTTENTVATTYLAGEVDAVYRTTVTVYDAEGNNATDVVNVTVLAEDTTPPTVVLEDGTAVVDEPVTLDASGSTDNVDDGIASYGWDWENDGAVDETTTAPTVEHTFTTVGEHTVRLVVTDLTGNTGETTAVVTVTREDTRSPVANAGADRRLKVGQTATFDGSASTDDSGTIAGYTWQLGDGTTRSGRVVTHSYSSTGTYTVILTVTDPAGNTGVDRATVVVEPASSGGGGGGSATGGTGLSTGAYSTRTADGAFDIRFRSLRSSEPATADLTWSAPDPATGIRLRSMTVTANEGGDYRLNVNVGARVREGVDEMPTAFGYVDVSSDANEGAIERATFRFQFREQRLERAGVAPEDVRLYHYETQTREWTRLETRVMKREEGSVTLEATSDGLSTFAVGAEVPAFEVTDVSLSESELTVGDAAEVSATVTNVGREAGSYDVTLAVGGETVATETVRLDAGESRTVTLAWTVAEAGSPTVTVNGVEAGSMTVSEVTAAATTTPTTTATTPTAETTTTEQRTPGFGLLVAVLALAAAALLAARREGRSD